MDEPAAELGRRLVALGTPRLFAVASVLPPSSRYLESATRRAEVFSEGPVGAWMLCCPESPPAFQDANLMAQDEIAQAHVKLQLGIPQVILHGEDGCISMGVEVTQDSAGRSGDLLLPYPFHSQPSS